MHAKLTADRLSTVAVVFHCEPTVTAAWLFGSVAKGRLNQFGDVDFAVLLGPDAPKGLDRFVLLDRLARAIADVLGVSEQEVDVVPLNDQGVVFQYEVLRTGRLIHELNRKARELFAWRVLRRYLDFRPTLDIFDRARHHLPKTVQAKQKGWTS